MKCPKCGCEVENGKFYCSTCGAEIQYVPNYEPEIEDSIDTSINDISNHFSQNKKKSNVSKIIVIIILFLLASIIFGTIYYIQSNSFDYQYKQALSYAEKEEYKHALYALEKAIALDQNNTDLILLKSEYYNLYGFRDTAKSILEDAIHSQKGTFEIYETLIQMYLEDENLDLVANLVRTTSNSVIFEKYKKYIADPPTFTYKGGIYYNKINLKLQSNENGTIYYTLNGTTPSSASLKYTEPLVFDEGTYLISAIFINDFGIESEVVTGEYLVDLSKPYAPEVNVYSGVTSIPKAIVIDVQEDCEVLYSLDGSEITEDSFHYSSPLAMPLGNFILRCVTMNKDQEFSNETTRSIELVIPGEISPEDAISIAYESLVESENIIDLSGNLIDQNGVNSYTTDSAFSYEGNPYYLIYEWHQGVDTTIKKTGNLYGVQMFSGEFSNVAFDEDGNYRIY